MSFRRSITAWIEEQRLGMTRADVPALIVMIMSCGFLPYGPSLGMPFIIMFCLLVLIIYPALALFKMRGRIEILSEYGDKVTTASDVLKSHQDRIESLLDHTRWKPMSEYSDDGIDGGWGEEVMVIVMKPPGNGFEFVRLIAHLQAGVWLGHLPDEPECEAELKSYPILWCQINPIPEDYYARHNNVREQELPHQQDVLP